jgi:hypothetical protein
MSDKPNIFDVDCIRTKHLSIIDDQGRERACLTCRPENGEYVVFDMKDKIGRPRVTIQLNDSEAHVMLFTEQNAPAISIGLNANRGNGIQIGRPGDGRPHIVLSVPGKDGPEELETEPSVLVIDADGRREFVLGPHN